MKYSQLNMLEHSKAKIKLLSLYMDRYLNILNQSRYTSDVYIYDMFCGKGKYEDGGEGSPVIFLRKVKEIFYQSSGNKRGASKFHCHFNDKDELKLEKLRSFIEKNNLYNSEIGSLKITSKDYRQMLVETIDELKDLNKEKAFIFIDPYGYKNIKAEDIRQLLKSENSEVLLFLPTQFMFRFEKKNTPKSLKKFISDLVPEEEWPDSQTGLDFIETLLDKFREFLGEDYFVDSFIIARDVNQYFCLFFFTSHIRGFEKMLEAKWAIDEEEGRGWKYRMDNDLFATQEKTPKTDKLKSELIDFLREERTNSELYQFCLRQGHRTTHITSILRDFESQDRLIKNVEDGSPARKKAFYINYSNHKNAPSKIKIKLRS